MAMDFYELDPDVVAIARRWFTNLRLSRADIRIVTGDGRLSLKSADGAAYDAVILDAFSSGAVPLHLLTKNAVALYVRRLKPGGVILVHVSNRYLDLRPVLAAAARDLGLSGASKRQVFAGRVEDGLTASVWVALSPDGTRIERLAREKGWRTFDGNTPAAVAWTDAHASILHALAY
ncbi:MAG: fused MFS/spermidine synthase, partial [Elusimicrobia bacterium]|nr:fused MFS/spermidine synthase [Elusimicrobiota bacterium]